LSLLFLQFVVLIDAGGADLQSVIRWLHVDAV